MNLQNERLHGDRKENNLEKLESSLIQTNTFIVVWSAIYLLFNSIKPNLSDCILFLHCGYDKTTLTKDKLGLKGFTLAYSPPWWGRDDKGV